MRHLYLVLLTCILCGCHSADVFFDDRADTFSPQPIVDDLTIKILATRVRVDWRQWGTAALPADARGRDKLVNDQIILIDAYYARYERQLARGRAASDLSLDLTSLFCSAAATVSGGEQAKTLLAGAAALASGSRLAIDESLYFKQTAPALTAKMRALRSEKLRGISRRIASQDMTQYSLAQAQHDVQEYYALGTIGGAVQAITQDAAHTINSNP